MMVDNMHLYCRTAFAGTRPSGELISNHNLQQTCGNMSMPLAPTRLQRTATHLRDRHALRINLRHAQSGAALPSAAPPSPPPVWPSRAHATRTAARCARAQLRWCLLFNSVGAELPIGDRAQRHRSVSVRAATEGDVPLRQQSDLEFRSSEWPLCHDPERQGTWDEFEPPPPSFGWDSAGNYWVFGICIDTELVDQLLIWFCQLLVLACVLYLACRACGWPGW